jgi:hypothetical protein
MNFLTSVYSSLPLRWWIALTASALGIAAICLRVLESDGARAKRAERNKKKELRSLAERISSYGQGVHQRYPTGDVIVSERDLSGEASKATRRSDHRSEPAVKRAESPTGSVERVLEIERLISRYRSPWLAIIV